MDDFKALFIPQIIGTENVERPAVLTEKMTKVLKLKVSYSNVQERMDDSAQNRNACVRVCARTEACRVRHCSCRHSPGHSDVIFWLKTF